MDQQPVDQQSELDLENLENLEKLKKELDKRLNYDANSNEQKKYDADLQKLHGLPLNQGCNFESEYREKLKKLENEKIKDIKNKHKDQNEYFVNLLLTSNDKINALEKKKNELNILNKKNFIDRSIDFITRTISREHSYKQQNEKLDREKLDRYKDLLIYVKSSIDKLLPIYLPPDSIIGGNKKHNKNIEKMYKIGKRYKLLSKNSYHMSGTPYAETRVFDGMEDGYYVFYMPSNPKIRYKYKPGLWIIKPCSSIKTKKDKCRKFRRTKRRT